MPYPPGLFYAWDLHVSSLQYCTVPRIRLACSMPGIYSVSSLQYCTVLHIHPVCPMSGIYSVSSLQYFTVPCIPLACSMPGIYMYLVCRIVLSIPPIRLVCPMPGIYSVSSLQYCTVPRIRLVCSILSVFHYYWKNYKKMSIGEKRAYCKNQIFLELRKWLLEIKLTPIFLSWYIRNLMV